MEPEHARLQNVCAWLSKAELDLQAAAHEISAPEERLWGDVMFHSQQAAEKAMKAFLACHDVPFRKTHNIEELGRQCVALDATLETVAGQAVPLTEYAWKFRYPGEPDEPGREEAERALAVATKCLRRYPGPSAAKRATVRQELRHGCQAAQRLRSRPVVRQVQQRRAHCHLTATNRLHC
jgi:HEPN domain-containing protein